MNPMLSLSGISRLVADHLWQSSLVAIVAAVLTWVLRRNRAQVRYWIWFAALMKFLAPFVVFSAVGAQLGSWMLPQRPPQSVLPFAIEAASQPFSSGPVRTFASTSTTGGVSSALPAVLLAIWLLGLAVILVAWWSRWRRVAGTVRQATPIAAGRLLDALKRVEQRLNIQRPVSLVMSDNSLEPGVFGILSPVFFWPNGLSDRLDDDQIDSIIAHELTHVIRRDNLTALLYLFVQAVFWFYPVVWFLGSRMVHERDRSCDEEVIGLGTNPHVYAGSLLVTCKWFVESPLTCVAGVTGADLKKRIEAIIRNDAGKALNLWKTLLLAASGISALAGPVIVGAVNSAHVQAQSQATQSPSSQPGEAVRIEVASVKRNVSDEPGPRFGVQSGGFNIRGITVKLMVQMAYGVQNFQISGGPKWMDSDRFDVAVKLESVTGNVPLDRLVSVLPRLLADRFGLKIHRETKDGDVYALTVGNGGPKITAAEGQRPYLASADRGYVSGTMDITTLANWLAWRLERPVEDRTGLSGIYDIELIWTPDTGQAVGVALPAPAPPPPPLAPGDAPRLPMRRPPAIDPSGPSLFTAVQEQLGLKLNSQRAPVNVLVIDHVEQPTPN